MTWWYAPPKYKLGTENKILNSTNLPIPSKILNRSILNLSILWEPPIFSLNYLVGCFWPSA